MIISLIPARGGSKSIPRKNLRLLAGKPLLAYSIEHAQQAPDVQRVFVSTDDAEIAEVARQFGAEVINRPTAISGDTASSESALQHALTHLQETEGLSPYLVVFLQATSPLRPPGAVQESIDTLRHENADSLLSICPVHGFIWRREGTELTSFSYDYRHRPRRQDAPEDFIENGSIYVFKPWVLKEYNNRLGGKIATYPMHALDSFQIDEPGDLDLIERLLTVRPADAAAPSLSHIRLLVLDFDGVMTDNRVLVNQDGREAVWCHRGDGWGLARLLEAGIHVFVLSTEQNPVVASRCKKLKLPYLHACDDKLTALKDLAAEYQLNASEIAFVGNDVNDLACLQWVGVPIAVADAMPEAHAAARLVTRRAGGDGAVREVADWIQQALNKDRSDTP